MVTSDNLSIAKKAVEEQGGQRQELPLVTVITPAYNRAALLEETILSVLNQDYPRLEYIVLDDGSTDETLQVMKRYEGRIRCLAHPNMGEHRTVNKGFALANGEIVGVVSSDDPLLPGAVSAAVRRLIAEPDLAVVYPDWNLIDEYGGVLEHKITYEYDFVNMVRWHHGLPGPGAFFRRELVAHLHGRDPQFRYVGDFDFWLRAGLVGPFARIPATLATFRTHTGSITANEKNPARAKEHIRLTKKFYALPNLPAEVLKVKSEAYSSTYYIAGNVLGEKSSATKKWYYFLALWYAPQSTSEEYRDRRAVMLYELTGTLKHSYITLLQTLRALLPDSVYRSLRATYRVCFRR